MKLFVALLMMLLTVPVMAQEGGHPYCGVDHSPEAHANLAAFHAARAEGRLPVARKSHVPPEIGDVEVFNVQEGANWTPLNFTLKDKTDAYHLWVENGELANGNVTDGEIAGLRDAMFTATPAASFDPSAGILQNNHAVFGLPPNYDGDGIVDILLYDIGFGNTSTLGYVSSADLNPNANPGVGNQADVLYLDSSQGTRNLTTLSAIAAHEYTHLIHFNFGFDDTFISEGLAEYAMVMNGYFWRGIDYLVNPAEYGLELFGWRTEPNGGPNARDYQRGGLFFTYVATQIGPMATGALIRTDTDFDGGGPDVESKGAVGLQAVLEPVGTSLAEMVTGFHLANFLNDVGLDPRYGYPMPERQSLEAPATAVIDGQATFNVEVPEREINSGAVRYITFENVADISINIDALAAEILLDFVRGRLAPRVILERDDGSVSVEAIQAGTRSWKFNGMFDRVTLVVVHSEPDVSGSKFTYGASWSREANPVANEEEPVLPTQITLAQNFPNPFNPSTAIRFVLPTAMPVRLVVYDALGRRMAVLADGLRPAGTHEVRLDATDWPSGLYLYTLETPTRQRTRTMRLVK